MLAHAALNEEIMKGQTDTLPGGDSRTVAGIQDAQALQTGKLFQTCGSNPTMRSEAT